MSLPPPQAGLIGLALAWNYQRSLVGKRTISQWAREHREVAVPAVIVGASWLAPHWWRRNVSGTGYRP